MEQSKDTTQLQKQPQQQQPVFSKDVFKVIQNEPVTSYQRFLANRVLIAMFSLFGLTGYWFIRAIQRSKNSIICIFISNMILHLFGKKSDIIIKTLTTIEVHRYFRKFQVIVEEQIPNEGCLLPFTPHCIFCFGMHYIMNMKERPIQNCAFMAARPMLNFAPYGFVLRWWGSVSPDPKNFVSLMKQKKNICWIPGGFEEATMTTPKEYRLFLKQRKGFIKYGLQFGYKVCPVFIFNENKCYQTTDALMKYRIKLNQLKIPGTIFYSKYGVFPDPDVDIYVVIGKSIPLPKIENPTREDINKYHQVYIDSLVQMFNKYVDQCDPGAKIIFEDEFMAKL